MTDNINNILLYITIYLEANANSVLLGSGFEKN